MTAICEVNDNCTKGGHLVRGWCRKHYARWKRNGDPRVTRRPGQFTAMWGYTPAERFWAKVDASGVCWEWTASTDGIKGYGRFDHQAAHRWAYEYLVGPIPDGMTVDHQCRNPPCVNPDHFELVTVAENTRRGGAFSARNARKTHCPKGHEYTPENTKVYIRPGGRWASRYCIACHGNKSQRQELAA